LWEAALAFAEDARAKKHPGYYETSIDRFCEALLIKRGRREEAYRNYGLRSANGPTNLAIFRSLIRAYPERDRRQVLLDLIETRGDRGKWFAAAKDAGLFDIAIECAAAAGADPSTVVRAARDFQGKEPKFAAAVALLALSSFLNGGGYDPSPTEAADAVRYLLSASRVIAAQEWALGELAKLSAQRCVPGRESFQMAIKTALSQFLGTDNKV
jgi:hypothetical protein